MDSKNSRNRLGCLPGSEQWPISKVLQKFKKAFPFKFQILARFLLHVFMLSAFSPVKVFKKLGSVPVFTVFTFIFTIITVFPKDSNAMVPLLTDLVGLYQTPTQTNQDSTCGNCHNAWGGRETRNNIGVAYYIFDNNGVTNSSTSKLSLNDADRDGYNNYTEFTNSQTTIQPGATTRWFASFPDKDGDGCIALYYRTDENGMPVPQDEIRTQGCVNGNTCYASPAAKGFNSFTPLGWDIDDNDASQGCASWDSINGPSPNPGTTSDITAPGQITNLRYDGTTLASQSIPLTWTAVADDGTTGTNAHSYDMRYTTESLAMAKTYCGGGTSICNVRLASDWLIMWDQPDCDVDQSDGFYLAKLGTPGGGGAGVPKCLASWNSGEIAPLMRALYEPVPTTPGFPEIYTIQMQGDTLSGISSPVYPNTIVDGITYWIAMRTSDGILIPKGNAGDGTVDDPTGFDELTFSAVSNIIAITPGTSTTGAAIQSYTSTIGKSASTVVEVHGLGLGASGIITQGRLYDATLGTITCSIDGPTRTDIYLKLTCNTSAATNGQYDLDLSNASSVTKAAWVDGVQITDTATTTVDDNTDPSNKYPTGGETNLAVSAFNISTTTGTDTVSQIQITRSGNGNEADISAVKLWRDVDQNSEYSAGDVQIGGTVFSANVATFSSLNESVDAIDPPEKYIITFDIVASPTTEGAHRAEVSGFVSGMGNNIVENDNPDAVLAIDWNAPTTTASATGYTFDTWIKSGSVPVILSGSDNVSGVASTKYCVDQGIACTPTTDYIAAIDVTCVTTCTQYVRYQSVDNAGNTETPVKFSIVKQDLQGPTDGTLSASPGDTQVVLNWTNATDSGSGLATDAYKVVYQQAATPPADCASGTQIYLGTDLTYTHTGLTNTLPYSYRVCAYDAVGNPPSIGATASATPVSTPTTNVNDGGLPSNKYAKASGTNMAVSAFTLNTSSGTDTITSITVTRSGTGADSDIAAVKIWNDVGTTQNEWDAGDTQADITASATFTVDVATFGSLNIPVNTTTKNYIITFDIAASPTNGNTHQAWVSGIEHTDTTGHLVNPADSADATITIDTVAPSYSWNTPAAGTDYKDGNAINVDVSITEAGSGITNGASCNAKIDGATTSFTGTVTYSTASQKCTGTLTLNSPSGLSSGSHNLTVQVSDNVGNTAQSSAMSIDIDNTVPSAPTLTTPTNASYTNDNTPTFDWSDVTDPSGVSYSIQADNNGSTYVSPEINQTGLATSTYTPGTSLADGTYTWHARAVDGVGNTGSWSSDWTVTVDTTAPTVSSTVPTSGATLVPVSTTITVNFTNGPIKCSSVTASTFSLLPLPSGTPLITCPSSSQVVYTPGSTLASSTTYTVNLTSGITDEAGNTLTAYNWSFTTQVVSDVTPPAWTPPTTGAQYVGDSGAGGKLVLCFNGATDTESSPVSYVAYYNTTTPASSGTSESIGSSPVTGDSASCGGSAYDYKYELTTSLTNGTKYYITVRAKDNVGNSTINEDNKAAIPYNRTLSVNGYNMISVPGELDAGFSTSIFGDDLSYVRVMGWNGSYTSALNMTEGSGYWILNSTGDNTTKIDIDSVGGDNGNYTAYTLQGAAVSNSVIKGWNLIGNPCLTNITGGTGGNITVTLSAPSASCGGTSTCTFAQAVNGTYVRNTVYRWDGSTYQNLSAGWSENLTDISDPNKMRPWAGYWLYVYNTTPYATGITITCGAQ